MVDRTDIDALLIGALYGELTPADEARLTAHLESHPADRTALSDLEQTRKSVRDSRILEVQLDPPQAVSALLLQEAHRRAPRREAGEGWFARFVRSFIAHPAMAAAAMLVVVVGVAGTLYMRNGSDMLEARTKSEAASSEPQPAAATTPTAAPGAPEVAQPTPPEAGSQMGVDLADKLSANDKDGKDQHAERQDLRRDLARAEGSAAPAPTKGSITRHDAPPAVKAPAKKGKILSVETKQPMPKELDEKKEVEATRSGFANAVGGASAGDTFAQKPTAPAPKAAAPAPPPPPAAQAPQQAATVDVAKQQPAKPDAMLAWAKQQHEQAKALTGRGDCVAAARIALDVSNRAPDYYQQFMETDRALKNCKPYIDRARDDEAEQKSKARAQKRVNAAEPDSVK